MAEYASANSSVVVVREFVTPDNGTIGYDYIETTKKYVALDKLQLAPDLTIIFNKEPQTHSKGPFKYSTTTGPETT